LTAAYFAPAILGAIALVFLFAGAVKGVIGLGLPTISMGLLTLAMPPAAAASVLIVPSLVTNIWQLFTGPPLRAVVKRFGSLAAGIVFGTLWSVLPPLSSDSPFAQPALGGVLIVYGAHGLAATRLPRASACERWLSPLVGYVTGAISAATGVFVIPAVPYLQSLSLRKDEMVQALGLAFSVATIALAVRLWSGAALSTAPLALSIVAVVPALAGMALGQRLRQRLSEETFRKGFFVTLIALGLHMTINALL
jgi:uncharacterized membrane protein YfcA